MYYLIYKYFENNRPENCKLLKVMRLELEVLVWYSNYLYYFVIVLCHPCYSSHICFHLFLSWRKMWILTTYFYAEIQWYLLSTLDTYWRNICFYERHTIVIWKYFLINNRAYICIKIIIYKKVSELKFHMHLRADKS